MRLQQRLDDFKRGFLSSGNVTPEMLAIMQKSTDELRAEAVLQGVLKTGQTAPSFELANQDGRLVSSSSLLAKGPLVLSFFRGVW
jgi:hypothetical protein